MRMHYLVSLYDEKKNYIQLKKGYLMWFLYAILSSISWCFVTIFGKLASQRVDPNMVTTIRSLLMTFMLVSSAVFFKQLTPASFSSIHAKDWGLITLAAAASSAAWLFYFTAFKYGLVSKVVSVDRLSFVFIMFLSAYIFGEELSWTMISGAALMVMGIMLIVIA